MNGSTFQNHQKLCFSLKSFRVCIPGSTFHNHKKLGFFVKSLGLHTLAQSFILIRNLVSQLIFRLCTPSSTFLNIQSLETLFLCYVFQVLHNWLHLSYSLETWFITSLGFAHLAQSFIFIRNLVSLLKLQASHTWLRPFLIHNHQKLCYFVKCFRFCTPGSNFHNHQKLVFFVKSSGFAHLAQPFLIPNLQRLGFFVKSFRFCKPGSTFHNHQKLGFFVKSLGFAHLAQPP